MIQAFCRIVQKARKTFLTVQMGFVSVCISVSSDPLGDICGDTAAVVAGYQVYGLAFAHEKAGDFMPDSNSPRILDVITPDEIFPDR